MEKIICDVCGTSYPQTAAQCPICGYARPSHAKAAPQDGDAGAGEYVHVKGGRFSSNNVRKRNAEKGIVADASTDTPSSKKTGSNMALGITAIVLLLVLIVVLVFFIMKVIDQYRSVTAPEPSGATSQTSGQPTRDPDVQILCQQIQAEQTQVTLAQAGDMWLIHATPLPEDTTDVLTYTCSDDSVITVDGTGRVTAVAEGEAVVTLTCGKATLDITFLCDFTPDDQQETGDWGLNRKDITLSAKGETWDLYSKSSTVSKTKIKWTSEDETIATVNNGVVEAVGNGRTKILAEYEGVTHSCVVRCKLPEEDTDQETQPDGEQQTQPTEPQAGVKISHSDVSIAVDESFNLRLKDAGGNTLEVTWTVSREGFVKIDGNTVTGVKSTDNDYVTIKTTYEGETYQCIVRVK